METFGTLDPLLKTFWLVAIPSSIFFLLQTLMIFIGGHSHDLSGSDGGFDTGVEGVDSVFDLFSLKNLIHFLLGFSWTGIAFYESISSPILLIGIALIVGVLFVYMFFVVIRQLQKLAEDNSFQLTDTLGQTAEVYLTIPEKKSGKGKILVSARGSVHELEALTEGEKILSGTAIKVVKIENGNIFVETI
ncbi:MAG: NfeD family protein [Bacteroidia bacterium]